MPARAQSFDIRQSVGRSVLGAASHTGRFSFFLADAFRGLPEVRIWWPRMLIEAWNIGIGSLLIVILISAFAGAVTALQTGYQFTGSIPYYVVGTLVVSSIILELGPVLTALILSGRIGARYAAELGTMRVTEQIDALETLAYDPIAYLVVPRVIAALIMLPILTILANAIGVGTAYATAVLATDVTSAAFSEGLRLAFAPFQIVYSIIKATIFGGAIAFFCSYEGYNTTAGAEGVGRSTAQAVVITSVAILVLDALTALLLAPYLQA